MIGEDRGAECLKIRSSGVQDTDLRLLLAV